MFSSGLSPAEIERLALVAEECGEVIQVIGKVLRHGYGSRHPSGGPENRKLLAVEIGDLAAAIALLTGCGDVDELLVVRSSYQKSKRIRIWLHHAHDGMTWPDE